MYVYVEHTPHQVPIYMQYVRVKSTTEAVMLVVHECAVTKYVLRGLS